MSGKFIVIEGSDGSGKTVQFERISERLRTNGHDVATYDFPQYDQPSSYFVREYLNGNYGSAEELGAYKPSLFYALDRFQSAASIKADLAAGKTVLSNRFTGSNMAHQGQKIHDNAERTKYYDWLFDLEFNILGIPKPDLNIVLLLPAEIAQKFVDNKSHTYTDKKRDIHEADLHHLERAVTAYEHLCVQFPNDFQAVQGYIDGEVISIPDITELILDKIQFAVH